MRLSQYWVAKKGDVSLTFSFEIIRLLKFLHLDFQQRDSSWRRISLLFSASQTNLTDNESKYIQVKARNCSQESFYSNYFNSLLCVGTSTELSKSINFPSIVRIIISSIAVQKILQHHFYQNPETKCSTFQIESTTKACFSTQNFNEHNRRIYRESETILHSFLM